MYAMVMVFVVILIFYGKHITALVKHNLIMRTYFFGLV